MFHFLVPSISVSLLDHPLLKHVFFKEFKDVCIALQNVWFRNSVLTALFQVHLKLIFDLYITSLHLKDFLLELLCQVFALLFDPVHHSLCVFHLIKEDPLFNTEQRPAGLALTDECCIIIFAFEVGQFKQADVAACLQDAKNVHLCVSPRLLLC